MQTAGLSFNLIDIKSINQSAASGCCKYSIQSKDQFIRCCIFLPPSYHTQNTGLNANRIESDWNCDRNPLAARPGADYLAFVMPKKCCLFERQLLKGTLAEISVRV
jgi:hypothetical protein